MSYEDDARFDEELGSDQLSAVSFQRSTLRRAFKAEDPGDAFTQRVLDRVSGVNAVNADNVSADNAVNSDNAVNADAMRLAARSREEGRSASARVSSSHFAWRVVLSFAASLAIAVGGVALVRHARYIEEGERARAQVLMALRLTSEKLNVVRSAVIETQEAH